MNKEKREDNMASITKKTAKKINKKTANRMTETQAWKYLAELWKSPTQLRTLVVVYLRGLPSIGLCSCIDSLQYFNEITESVHQSMDKEIHKLPNKHRSFYKWETTKKGAKQRSKFCLKMAKKTKTKKGKHVD